MTDQAASTVNSGPTASDSTPSQDKPKPYYSVGNILGAAKKDDGLSVDTFRRSADSVYQSKCFRTSFLWAAGLGFLFAAHRFKQGGTIKRITGDGVLATILTFGSQWYLCRADEVDRRVALKAFYMQQSRKTSGANAPKPEDSDASLDVETAVERELSRVTQYDLPVVNQGPARNVEMR